MKKKMSFKSAAKTMPEDQVDLPKGIKRPIEDIIDYKLNFDFNKLHSLLEHIVQTQDENKKDITNLRKAFITYKEENDLQGHIEESNERFSQHSVNPTYVSVFYQNSFYAFYSSLLSESVLIQYYRLHFIIFKKNW